MSSPACKHPVKEILKRSYNDNLLLGLKSQGSEHVELLPSSYTHRSAQELPIGPGSFDVVTNAMERLQGKSWLDFP